MKRLLLVFLVLLLSTFTFAQLHMIDNFDEGTFGHFNSTHPTYSGSSVGFTYSNYTLDSVDAYNGVASMHFTLTDNIGITTPWGMRFVSGTAASLAQNDTLQAMGYIGYALKATGGNDSVWAGIGIDAPATAHRSDSIQIIFDGQWRLYQWDLEDSTQWNLWVAATGVPTSPVSVDAIWLWAVDGTPDVNINIDYLFWNPGGPVPVELTNFKADVAANKVELRWLTATESNNSGFEVERKFEKGGAFQKVGFVNGNGTTTKANLYTYTDEVQATGNYYYRLKQVDFDGTFEYSNTIEVVVNAIPGEYTLAQNYPNPFNPATSITYNIPENGYVNLTVFNLLGEKVADLVNTMQTAGTHTVNFNASSLASGTYIYSLNVNGNSITKKMSLIK